MCLNVTLTLTSNKKQPGIKKNVPALGETPPRGSRGGGAEAPVPKAETISRNTKPPAHPPGDPNSIPGINKNKCISRYVAGINMDNYHVMRLG